MSHDDHDHDHPHDPVTASEEPAVAARVRALEELLLEKGIVERDELRQRIDWLVSRTPADAARLVARAWIDEDFKERLLADARQAALELDVDPGPSPVVVALENTDDVHHMVVCTLCSCYPKALLGPPPEWYKSLPYRSRAVSDPRGVLREFGLTLEDDVELRVVDSTADIRYLVVPRRPAGDGRSRRGRARLTRDARLDDRRLAARAPRFARRLATPAVGEVRRGFDRPAGKVLDCQLASQRGTRTTAGDQHARAARQVTHVTRLELRCFEHGENDHLGCDAASRVRDRLDRGIGAEKRDAPAAISQDQSEDDEPEIVLLAGRSSEQRVMSRPATPATAERHEPAADEVAREVLLRDRDLAALPSLADVLQQRQDHFAQERLEAQRRDQPIDRRMPRDVVERLERDTQLRDRLVDRGR